MILLCGFEPLKSCNSCEKLINCNVELSFTGTLRDGEKRSVIYLILIFHIKKWFGHLTMMVVIRCAGHMSWEEVLG